MERLENFPYSGWSVPDIGEPDLREIIYRGYRIFHMVIASEDDKQVDVLAVVHSSRKFGGGVGSEGEAG